MKYQSNLGAKSQTAANPTFDFIVPANSYPVGSEIVAAVVKAEGYAGLNRPKSNYKLEIVQGNTIVYTSSTVALNNKYQLHTFKKLEQYFASDGESLTLRFVVKGTYRYYEFRNVSVNITYNPPETISKVFVGATATKAIFVGNQRAKSVFIGSQKIL